MFYIAPVLLSLCVVQIVMAAVLLTFWRMRTNAPGLAEMATAMTVGSLGALVMGVGVSGANLYFAFAGTQCFVIAILSAARAMRRLQGLVPLRITEAVIFCCCAAGDAYFLFFASNFSGISVLHSAAYAIICTVTARTLFREPSAALKPGCRVLSLLFGLFAAVCLVRAAVRLYADIPVPVNMPAASVDIAFAFFGIAISIGWTLGFVWTAFSVSEYRLRAANDKLKRFSSAVAHDLNTPLNAVIGYIDAIHHLPADDTGRRTDYLSTARKAAMRMNRFIHLLLEESSTEGASPAPVPVNTRVCMDDALTPLRTKLEAAGAEIAIADTHNVMADPFQMTRVFQNLFDNAIKYRSDERPLRIRISSTQNGKQVLLSVNDNGLGIAKEDQQRIFEQFERANDSAETQGYGLGLSECKRIVESYGGSISVESRSGNGTAFILTIPAA